MLSFRMGFDFIAILFSQIYFDSFSNRATVLMMSDNKEILFHHDVNALRIEPSFNPTHVIWTGIKVGSQDSQKITVSLENAALASQLKEVRVCQILFFFTLYTNS